MKLDLLSEMVIHLCRNHFMCRTSFSFSYNELCKRGVSLLPIVVKQTLQMYHYLNT